jgi:Secretion system C-terminal sorting domain/Chaperone of endosialidase
LGQLQAKTYEFRKDGQYQFTSLPQGKQIGFLAQDVEKILPELVSDAPLYIHDQTDGRQAPRTESIKAINYTGLIPILTQAINELSAEINQLKTELATLKSKAANNIQSVTGQLLQNTPNPFSQSTVIRYNLAQTVKQASLLIFDLQGKQVKQITLSSRSNGSYTLQAGELTAGMYIYTLLADGKEIESLRMILTKE